MLNEFINDLKSSPYYNRLFVNHDIIMLCMYGSRQLDVVDSKSDYDLVAITSDLEEPSAPEEFLTYNGIKVHWYYKPISSIIDARRKTHSYFGAMQFALLKDDLILYENPAYMRAIQFLKNRKEVIGRINAYNLVNAQQALIDSVLSESTISEQNYTKFLYHLCYTSYYLLGETIDKDFLVRVKRIREFPITEQDKQQVVLRLQLLRQFVNNNRFDVDNAVAVLDGEAQTALQSM